MDYPLAYGTRKITNLFGTHGESQYFLGLRFVYELKYNEKADYEQEPHNKRNNSFMS